MVAEHSDSTRKNVFKKKIRSYRYAQNLKTDFIIKKKKKNTKHNFILVVFVNLFDTIQFNNFEIRSDFKRLNTHKHQTATAFLIILLYLVFCERNKKKKKSTTLKNTI